jgi:DNA-binding response OmpR family regulator
MVGPVGAVGATTMWAMDTRAPRPILVVDDDVKIRRLVRMYLEREGFRVIEAADGRAALASISLEAPALVVLDIMLPEVDGLAIIRAVRRTDRTPIIVLSALGRTDDRISGLAAGADDYLPKPFSPAELVLRVKRVIARTTEAAAAETSTGRGPLRHGDLVLDRERHEARLAGRELGLTRVEFKLLATLLEAGGRVLSRDRLLDLVYGDDGLEILDRTIDVHIRRLRDKLGDDPDAPRYIATVRGVGYRAAPEADAGTAGAGERAPR